MGLRIAIAFSLLLILTANRRVWAAPFVNLNFEQATVPAGTQAGDSIPASSALPGWTLHLDSSPATNALYNSLGSGAPTIALFHPTFNNPSGVPTMQGSHVAAMVGDATHQASLTQVGDIPAGTHFLEFLAQDVFGPPDVFLNGVQLTVLPVIEASNNISQYRAEFGNVSGLAELRLVSGSHTSAFDAIHFGLVPEPSSSLIMIGAAFATFLRRRVHRS